MNEYPNIFVSKKLTRTNIRIYSYPKNDTNEYPNKYLDQKYSNIRIHSSHSGVQPYMIFVADAADIVCGEFFSMWRNFRNGEIWDVETFQMPSKKIWYNSYCFIVRSSCLVDFMLFCGKISFVAIYDVLSQNMFVPIYALSMRRKIVPKILSVSEKWQISCMCSTMSQLRSTFLEISSEGQWPFSLLFSRCHAIKLLLFYCDCTWHTGLHNAKYRMHKYTNTQILPQILPLHIAYRVAHCKIQNAH